MTQPYRQQNRDISNTRLRQAFDQIEDMQNDLSAKLEGKVAIEVDRIWRNEILPALKNVRDDYQRQICDIQEQAMQRARQLEDSVQKCMMIFLLK